MPAWTKQTFETSLSAPYFAFAGWHQSQLLGYYIGHCVFDDVTLMDIAVSPAYRSQGIAQQLVVHFLQQAKRLDALQCLLEVRASNQHAMRLYERNGFVQIDRRKNYYPSSEANSSGSREDAIIMQLLLAS